MPEIYECEIIWASTPGKTRSWTHPIHPPVYGQKIQYAADVPEMTFTPREVKNLQVICGKFIYPAVTVDNTMLLALNDTSVASTRGNDNTMHSLNHFLDYVASNPDAEVLY